MVMQSNTEAQRRLAVSRTRARLQVNPRISAIAEVSVEDLENGDGFDLRVRASAVDGPLAVEASVTPKGVR